MNTIAIVQVSLLAVVALTGVIMAITPYLMPHNECFAVTVPPDAQNDPRLRALKRRFLVIMLALTALLAAVVAVNVFGSIAPDGTADDGRLTTTLLVGTLAPLIAGFVLMLVFRARVRDIKRREGWRASGSQAAAVVAEGDIPRPVSLWWNLLYLPIFAFTGVLGALLYPQMPDLIPMHADFAGNVNGWTEKTPFAVATPVLIQLVLAVSMLAAHVSIVISKRGAQASSPAATAWAYGMFARAQSAFLLVAGLLLSLAIGVLFQLSSAQVIALSDVGVIMMLVALLVVLGAVALAVVYGQAGSRLLARTQAGRGFVSDTDEHWLLGVFYYNPEDASLFLPERFGVGWTLNLARPAAWAIVAGLAVVITAATVVLVAAVG